MVIKGENYILYVTIHCVSIKKYLCLFGLTEACEGLGQHDNEADRNVHLVGIILNLLQCTIT